MSTNILHQEILLLTDTNFSHRILCDKDEKDGASEISDSEKLEKACWEGMLGELFPEIFENKSLSLWQIIETEFSLQIELSPYPSWERRSSIDPYYFLKTISYN
jgi:hypothetical protein